MNNNETIQEISDDFLKDFFGGEQTTSIMDKEETEKKEFNPIKGMSEHEPLTISFADDDDDEELEKEKLIEDTEEEEEEEVKKEVKKESATDEKVDAINVITSMIKEGELLGFEDSDIETTDDLRELIKLNLDHVKSNKPLEEVRNEFFESLPEEFRIAADFIQRGATPAQVKGLFKAFSEVEAVKTIDDSTSEGQKEIIRQYLSATNFGDADDINEEIESWEDLDKLEEKASKFKPKLEKMREKIIQKQMEDQEHIRREQHRIQQEFINGVDEALSKTDLVNIKLPKADRLKLRKDLTENNYNSLINGRPINGLGKILEEITFVKPNPGFLAELTYFATNPNEFINKLREQIKQEELGKTVKKLKIETVSQGDPNTKKGKLRYRGINEME